MSIINSITSYIDQNVPNQRNKSKGFGVGGTNAIGGGSGDNYQTIRRNCVGAFGRFVAGVGVSYDKSISSPSVGDICIHMTWSPGDKGLYGGYDFHKTWRVIAENVSKKSGVSMMSNKRVFSEDYNGHQKLSFAVNSKNYQQMLTAIVEVYNEFCDNNQ